MTINTIDPSTPDPNDVAGQGDDQIRAFKQAVVDTFTQAPVQTPLDPWDIPLQVGPRELNGITLLATQVDLAALDVRVGANEVALPALQLQITNNDADILALQADSHTITQALAAAWPVGSLYCAADGASPDTKGIPGVWAAIGDGRFPLGAAAGPYGTTGGSAGNSVTLVEANLPQHKHQHSTYRENSLNSVLPATFFTDPVTSFSSHLAGRDSSTDELAVFNTDEGVNLSPTPTAIDLSPAFFTVRFYQRTS